MAAKRKSRGTTGDGAQSMRDSAHRIWLAGLGAFERAKSEGPKMFEALVSQGMQMRGRATEAADAALTTLREQAGDAQGKWDKLEQVFEDRVARSLHRLGVLTKGEVDDLAAQVRELNESVRGMMHNARPSRPKSKRKAAAKGATKKKAARKAKRPTPA
ncbi:MAG: phasin family protein [Usitatibacter sp.]